MLQRAAVTPRGSPMARSNSTCVMARVSSMLRSTFARRASQQVPPTLPDPPSDWGVPYGRMAREIGLDPDIEAGHAAAARMLDTVLSGEVVSASWDPATGRWR